MVYLTLSDPVMVTYPTDISTSVSFVPQFSLCRYLALVSAGCFRFNLETFFGHSKFRKFVIRYEFVKPFNF